MKNIGIFVNGLNSEYSIEIIDGISDFFKDKDVRLVFAQTRVPHCDTGIYEYHYWSTTSFFNNAEIDAIIVVCGEYTSQISIPKLSSALSNYKTIPVISIGQELFLAKNSFTHADCKSSYNEVISHLKNVHGCRKIAFFSANQTNSEEGLERFEAYKSALKTNELFFNRNLVLNGNFTDTFAYDEVLRKYKSKDDINFDAILCANDLTAIGCQQALQRLGVSIPEDVKIIGFDDSYKAETVHPKLSTLNQNIYNQGTVAAELTYNILFDKKKYSRTTKTPVNPIYRQSCGCIPLSVQDNVYKNEHGDTCYKNAEEISRLKIDGEYFNYLRELKKVYNIYSLLHSDYNLQNFSYTLRYLLENAEMTSAAVCLFDEPISVQAMDDFELPRNMNISMLVDIEKNIEIFEPNITFNPKRRMFHEEYFDMESGSYIFSPIFSAEKNYGYIICKVKKLNFAIYSIFMKILINSISQAYEYTITTDKNQRLAEENIMLYQNFRTYGSTQSKIDELTKFLNKRGFTDIAQQRIDLALDSKCTGLVIYADLDNMKTINDTYGSDIGDTAIKAMGTVLGRILRANDVVGRISGDKFAAVAVGLESSKIDMLREKINKECIKISKEKNLEFILTCTIGAVEFNKINSKLKHLIEEAEKSIYSEKDDKHLSGKLQTFHAEDENSEADLRLTTEEESL